MIKKVTLLGKSGGYFFLSIFTIATTSMATPRMIVNSLYVEIFAYFLSMRFGFFTIIAGVTEVANRLPCLWQHHIYHNTFKRKKQVFIPRIGKIRMNKWF